MKTYPTTSTHIPPDRVSTVRRVSVPGYCTELHEHDEYMFLLPRAGLLVLNIESNTAPVRIPPMSFAVVPPKRFHETHGDRGAQEHIAVYVQSDFVAFCEGKASRAMSKDRVMVYPAPWPLLSAVRLRSLELGHVSSDLAGYRSDLVDRVVATSCIEAGLAGKPTRLAPSDARRDLIEDIKAFLDATLSQRLEIDRVADEFGLSRRHLTRIFRESVGETVVGYQSRQRVARAASLLKSPGTTVVVAAAAVGIESPSYLARLFSKYGEPLPGTFKK
jgi:AraC-like DNA-binding protein